MNNNVEEKALRKIEKQNILYKIKVFLKSFFKRKNIKIEFEEKRKSDNMLENNSEQNSLFRNTIKNIEDDETRLLKLQRQYRQGEISEEDLTEEQIISLCELYDKQIAELEKSNKYRKNKILLYRQRMRNISRLIKIGGIHKSGKL